MPELPDERTVLKTNYESLNQELTRIVELLTPTKDHPLGEYIERIQDKFRETQDQITKALFDVSQAIDNSDEPLECAWRSYVDLKTNLMPSLSSEVLAIMGGIYLIKANLDHLRHFDDATGNEIAGMALPFSNIAQGLVKDLSIRSGRGWAGVLIVGEERLGHTVPEIIRLRFPACDVWHLPFTAHEYGYLVAKRVPPGTFLRFKMDALRQHGPDDTVRYKQQDTILCRLFADAFATFFVGPAYVYALLHLRFIPDETLYEPSTAMPPFAERFVIALETLKWMNEDPFLNSDRGTSSAGKEAKPLFDDEVNEQTGIPLLWRETIKASKTGDDKYDTIAKKYEPFLIEVRKTLQMFNTGFKGTRDNWQSAQELKSHLTTVDDVKVEAWPSMWALLNAAWSARWDQPRRWELIQSNVLLIMKKDPSVFKSYTGKQSAAPKEEGMPDEEIQRLAAIVKKALIPDPENLRKFEAMSRSGNYVRDSDIFSSLYNVNREAYEAYTLLCPKRQSS